MITGDEGVNGAPDAGLPADVSDTVIRLIEPRVATDPRPLDVAVDEVLGHLPASTRGRARASAPDADGDADDDQAHAPVAERGEWMLVVRGSTTSVPLDRPVLVGRKPGAFRVPTGTPVRRLVVPADRRGVSSTHAQFEQVGDSLVVSDAGSTNGLVVHWASGPPRRLRPGESCVVLPDAAVDLGDGIVIEFHPRPRPPKEHP